ncbi:MAG: hypothetical protein ACD_49C00049G0019 [uncultured bacterium (gcode 4)]|uniref:Uncharacterized protein n=1 Tax=uncultured bacterium (gcode 4) TaxID=1234023 RepID=K2AXA9_9BACT|nr:MAG: hypothetical protein ACD_49C00049G0019 [uncultured bacterium (gcode 4)]
MFLNKDNICVISEQLLELVKSNKRLSDFSKNDLKIFLDNSFWEIYIEKNMNLVEDLRIDTKWFLEKDFYLNNDLQNDLIEIYISDSKTLGDYNKEDIDKKIKNILIANNMKYIFRVLRDYWINNSSEYFSIWISNWILWFINSLPKFNKEKSDKLTSCSYNYIRKALWKIFEEEDESQFADDIRHVIRLINNIRNGSDREEYRDNKTLLNKLIFDIDSIDDFLINDNISDYFYLFWSRKRQFVKEYFNKENSLDNTKHKINLKTLKSWIKKLIADEVNTDFLKSRIEFITKELAWEYDSEIVTTISNDVTMKVYKTELREVYIREIKMEWWKVWATLLERICVGCFLDSFFTLREWSKLIWEYNKKNWINNFHNYFAKFDFKDKDQKNWIYNHYDETLDYINPEDLAEILWISRQAVYKAESSFKNKFDSYFMDKNIKDIRDNTWFVYNRVIHKNHDDKKEKQEYISPENVVKYKIKKNLWYQEDI